MDTQEGEDSLEVTRKCTEGQLKRCRGAPLAFLRRAIMHPSPIGRPPPPLPLPHDAPLPKGLGVERPRPPADPTPSFWPSEEDILSLLVALAACVVGVGGGGVVWCGVGRGGL